MASRFSHMPTLRRISSAFASWRGFVRSSSEGNQPTFRESHHDVVPHADLVEEPHLLEGPGDSMIGRLVRSQDTDANRVR